MGLLSLGTAFDWPEASVHAHHVRRLAIRQLVHLFRAHQARTDHGQLLWGDEIEYLLIALDHPATTARLSLSQLKTLTALRAATPPRALPTSIDLPPTFHQEYGRFMLESTPGAPYGPTLADCLKVEPNMRFRRILAQNSLPQNHLPLTLTCFPRLGAPGPFTEPYHPPCGPVAQSLYLPDQLINEHVRFPTLTANIRQRRGSKVEIYVPIYQDSNTPYPFRDPTVPSTPCSVSGTLQNANHQDKIAIPDVPDQMIYLDAMGFGMGCCCLQLTFQTPSLSAARRLYDALVPIAPIMMALSAGSPIFKGFLSDRDTRWSVISGSVDDRNLAERAGVGRMAIPKSRYASVSVYISDEVAHKSIYDDIPAPVDAGIEAELLKAGFDRLLARHFAHLFIRDPIVIFSESLTDLNPDSTDHFENIQSTNWQSVRFKPPPAPDSSIGWRVEFRTMEIQLTDFENAAYAIFIRLLTLAILASDDINFYLPLSKVDENMRRAEERDSSRNQKFWFMTRLGNVQELSISQIICGTDSSDLNHNSTNSDNKEIGFIGLMGIVKKYILSIQSKGSKQLDDDGGKLDKYLDFINDRASGRLLTTASYIRKFIDNHPSYKHDSLINDQINYDLIMHAKAIEEGSIQALELLGEGYMPFSI